MASSAARAASRWRRRPRAAAELGFHGARAPHLSASSDRSPASSRASPAGGAQPQKPAVRDPGHAPSTTSRRSTGGQCPARKLTSSSGTPSRQGTLGGRPASTLARSRRMRALNSALAAAILPRRESLSCAATLRAPERVTMVCHAAPGRSAAAACRCQRGRRLRACMGLACTTKVDGSEHPTDGQIKARDHLSNGKRHHSCTTLQSRTRVRDDHTVYCTTWPCGLEAMLGKCLCPVGGSLSAQKRRPPTSILTWSCTARTLTGATV